jgi:hypothetical protein
MLAVVGHEGQGAPEIEGPALRGPGPRIDTPERAVPRIADPHRGPVDGDAPRPARPERHQRRDSGRHEIDALHEPGPYRGPQAAGADSEETRARQ